MGGESISDKYDDSRAHALRERYHATFGCDELPVPVESIAEDLLGLAVEARELEVSGMLLPAERRILVNGAEPESRRRFTIAHELGHWICQCLDGTAQPVYCRAEEIGVDPGAKALEREANIFAAELLMPEHSVRAMFRRGGLDSGAEMAMIDGVAEKFSVSTTAAWWRLHSFSLVDAAPERWR